MKRSHALIVAIVLGIGGAMLNSYYLYKKSQAVEKVEFVGIASEVSPGERLLREHLKEAPITVERAAKLDTLAFRWDAVETVINKPVSRSLQEGWLLLEDDLRTPSPRLELKEKDGKKELAWPIPVDTRALVPSLIKPGDEVYFLGAPTPVAVPTPASVEPVPENGSDGAESVSTAGPRVAPGSSRIIGPFIVLALGNRLGSAEVMRAAKIRQVQENVMLVKVIMNRQGTLEPPADELLALLEATGSRPLGYFWRPRPEENN